MREFQRSHNGRGFIRVLPRPQPLSEDASEMARISDGFLDCVVYLYPSNDDAENGSGIGGSGFLAGVPSEGNEPFWFLYVVTAKHVILKGSLFVRMTTADGKNYYVHETRDDEWLHHPDGDDLTVCMISFDPMKFQFNHIPINSFLRESQCSECDIGIGDEAFIVGRFINHEGRQRNSPTARSGIISQMPIEPIRSGAIDQECFLVEARSIGGFSGSPVFWRVLPFSGARKLKNWRQGELGPLLLGVEIGYLYDWSPICNSAGRPIMHGGAPAQQVQINTGMMVVVPAWRLVTLLSEGIPMARRQEIVKQLHEQKKTPGGVALSSSKTDDASSAAPDNDANPNHLTDFTRLVDVAARKRPQDDQT